MDGIIWYWRNYNQAKDILRGMLDKYKEQGINPSIKYTHPIQEMRREMFVALDNGDRWRVIQVNPQTRGMKCNISYISYSIPEEMVNNIIKPCTIDYYYPYRGFNYWTEE